MGINMKNGEGYCDPTAYEAMTAVQREERRKSRPYRPLVFICSPFAGEVERNIQNARRYCRFAVEQGAIPLAPHLLYPQFMDDGDKAQRDLAIFFGLVIMGKCDELWAFGDTVTKGMDIELTKARARGLPIKFYNGNGGKVNE